MRRVHSKTQICALIVLGALVAACSPDEAETTSTEPPAGTTSPPSTTTTTATIAEPTTTQPGSTSTAAAISDPGDLLVIGDWGSGTLPQGAVAGAMLRYAEDNEVAAILTTGDNFYSDDAAFLMEPYGWATDSGIPFWIAWGNHDVESDQRVDALEETFDSPPRWAVYEWGKVDVVILDSTQIDSDEQAEFLIDTLGSSDGPTIMVFHHPPYSCGDHGDAEGVQDQWLDDLDGDVFLVLTGHEHNYQRFEESTVTYVVTGGGGAALTELAECTRGGPGMVAGESTHHFLALEQSDVVSVQVLDVNGQAIDRFTLGLP